MGPTPNSLPDHGQAENAHALARRIQDYWHALGFIDARAWAAQSGRGAEGIWIVQSNLVNGTPPGRRAP